MLELLKKKKFWTAVLTIAGVIVARYTGNPEVAETVMYVGLAVIGGLMGEDWGKAKVKEGKK